MMTGMLRTFFPAFFRDQGNAGLDERLVGISKTDLDELTALAILRSLLAPS